ncbi:MAG TPA: ABC transporter ATP-binding protein [Thermomicrobiales bacterium]|nr:ABC transporter ATP-binding protein [Thermomicrobiales bacterium]
MGQVEFIQVSKRYGAADAVSNVNLAVADHEFIVLLGPSGCGKSTLLKMVAGLEDVTGGEIYIDGRLVNYARPSDRNVAMVFQNYALYPHMTVFDNIAFPLKMTGVAKADTRRRTLAAAQALGLETYLERRPEQLSGGQRQRVALGRAIVREPAVFLMDEPLSNLDAQLRVQTREELLKLHARLQTTTIYVTHDQIEAMTMGHRIVVMRSGVIQQVGRPQEVYDHPANTFVAAFLGSPRINLHAGALAANGDRLMLRLPEGTIPLPDRLAAQARQRSGAGEVALGVRPEDISVLLDSGGIPAGSVGLPATAALVEPVGSDLFVNASAGGVGWIARAAPRLPVTPGQPVTLALDLAQAHLFGPDGRNLAPAS